MKNLIKALQIFLKYGDESYPTHCEHDTLYVHGYNKDDMSEADVKELDELGFIWDEDMDGFMSYKYGSC